MKSKLLLLVPLMLLLSACSNNLKPDSNETDILDLPVGVLYPQQTAGFELLQQINDPNPQIGQLLEYTAADIADLKITVFVYFAGLYASVDDILDFQIEQLQRDIASAAESGLYSVGEVLKSQPHSIRNDDREWQGYRHFFELSKQQNEFLSIADLFALPPYIVKVRATFPAAGNTFFDDTVSEFEQDLLGSLTVTDAVRCDTRLRISPAQDGEQWISIQGRAISFDPDKQLTADTEVNDVLMHPMVMALERSAERRKDCTQ